MAGALGGLRVIDCSQGVAGGYCTRLLAGLGADVIKVEQPRTGDVLRRAGPFPGDVPHIEMSALHLHLNAAKHSITLDVASSTGASLLDRLLATADVLLVGDDRGTPLPLDPDAIAVAHPSIVVATVAPFAPGDTRRSTEIVSMAASGYLSLNGDPDRAPVKVYGDQSAYQGGLHAALGIMAALASRDASGAGQRVDASITDAVGFLHAGALQRWAQLGRPQVRAGARPAGFSAERLYPSTVRPCADGHVHVHCHNRFHDLLAVLMETPRLADPDVLATPLGHADEIDALMDRWLASRTRLGAVADAQDLRIPMTEVLTPGEVMRDVHGQHEARGFLAAVTHPVAGELRQPGAPIRMMATPWRVARAPLLGEHNVEILCGELGLSTRDLAALAAAGVV
jgi:crotonobetainyl-CoA:carnitine CoA-transferase CaiB-like acyl-CoA transferase